MLPGFVNLHRDALLHVFMQFWRMVAPCCCCYAAAWLKLPPGCLEKNLRMRSTLLAMPILLCRHKCPRTHSHLPRGALLHRHVGSRLFAVDLLVLVQCCSV